MKNDFIKKLTFHNIFIKWPRIFIYEKIRERTKKTFLRGVFFHKNPIIITEKHGIRFVLYPWDKTPLEKLLTQRMFDVDFMGFKKLVKNNDLVFDVGANIGIHTTILSKLAGIKGKVYSFEPVPQTFNLLNETIALNYAHNVSSINIAFLEKRGSMEMNIFDTNYSAYNSFGNPIFGEIKAINKIDVEVDTVDNFCKKNSISRINFMKVDVEGFEKNVFAGARNMLENGLVDYLSFEVSKIPLDGNQAKAKDIFDILKSFSYKSYRYDPGTNKFDGPINDSNEFYENYYASRNDLTKI